MKRRLAAGLLGMALPAAALPFDYPVTFATTECNGDSGFISVDASRVYRIQTVACQQGHALQQVLLRRENGEGYDLATVTPADAEALRAELGAWAAARRRLLENGGAVIVTD